MAKKQSASLERKGIYDVKDAITEESIRIFKVWTPKYAAEACFNRLKFLEENDRLTHIERGLIIIAVEENEWFRHSIDPRTGEGYSSIDRWLTDAAPISRSACYAAKGAILNVGKDIPLEKLNKIPQCNLDTVKRISTATRQRPEVIEAAIELPENKFLEKIENEFPEEHIETKKPMILRLDKSERIDVNEGLAIVMWAEEAKTREEALVVLVNLYKQSLCEMEGYTGMSYAEAYAKAKESGDA